MVSTLARKLAISTPGAIAPGFFSIRRIIMTELVQLPHFVSVENLTVDQINALIDRAYQMLKAA